MRAEYKSKLVAAFALLFVFSFSNAVRAELPPTAYKDMQKKAPESLVIKVLSVKTEEKRGLKSDKISVVARARVERVNRTGSGLRKGAVIEIRYEHLRHKTLVTGPSQIRILKKDETVPAFLKKAGTGEAYVPAAGGYSFRELGSND